VVESETEEGAILEGEKASSDEVRILPASTDNNGLLFKASLLVMVIVAVGFWFRKRSQWAAELKELSEKNNA